MARRGLFCVVGLVALTGALPTASVHAGGVPVDQQPADQQPAELVPAAPSTAPVETALSPLLDSTDDGYLVRFADGVAATDAGAVLDELGVIAVSEFEDAFVGAHVHATAQQLAALRSDPRVLAVAANTVREVSTPEPTEASASRAEVTEAAIQTGAPWALDRIDQRRLPLNGGFDVALTGAGVTAYVLDSGVNAGHVEFSGRVLAGSYVNDGNGAQDCRGHGTLVAGLLGGETYGVAKDVTIVPVRVLDCNGDSTSSSTISGLNWIIANHQAGQPAVLNMSLVGVSNPFIDAAVNSAIDDGIVVVAAAGNDGGAACANSPARVPGVITVAAIDRNDASPAWSNKGSCVDVFAPGDKVLSAWSSSTTAVREGTGTSMATPLVSGAAALILQESPNLTPAQVVDRLLADATTGVVSNPADSPNRSLFVPTRTYVPLTPARLTDSRAGASTVDGQGAGLGLRRAVSVTEVVVAGRGGVPVDASAVVLNVTITDARAGGYATVFPCGSPLPTGSSINFWAKATLSNAVVAKVGANGRVCVFSSVATHLLVDVNGYYPARSSFVSLSPSRLMDSREGMGTIDGGFAGVGVRAGGVVTELLVGGRGGVPADASAVVLNVTVTEAQNAGFMTVFPCGTELPNGSNLNVWAGGTISNAVVAKLGVGGKVCLFSNMSTHVVVDADGFYPAGSSFVPLSPARLSDTRPGNKTIDGLESGVGARGPGYVTEVQVGGRGGVPADASAVVLNVTVTEAQAAGFVTVFPCGTAAPNGSNLNFWAGATLPNAVVAMVGAGGRVCLYSNVALQLIVDVNGYQAP